MQIKKPFYKITFEDIDIASEFFDHNQKHLSEFIMATIAYYSGKNVEIKSKIVEKYFKTYKKTMDSVILAKESGLKGAILKAEKQLNNTDTLEGGFKDSIKDTLAANNKIVTINNKEVSSNKEEENIISDIFSFDEFWTLYPNKVAKEKCKAKYEKLKIEEKQKIFLTLEKFTKWKPFENYNHPNPETYINQKRWDDVLTAPKSETPKYDMKADKNLSRFF